MVQKGAPVGLTRASSQVTSEVSMCQTEQSIVPENLTRDTPSGVSSTGTVARSRRDQLCGFVEAKLGHGQVVAQREADDAAEAGFGGGEKERRR